MAAWLDVAALLSLAAGYAGPLFTWRAVFGPAGRRRSLEEFRDVLATPPFVPHPVRHSRASSGSVRMH